MKYWFEMTIGDVIFYCLVETVKKQNTFTEWSVLPWTEISKWATDQTESSITERSYARGNYEIMLNFYLQHKKNSYQY